VLQFQVSVAGRQPAFFPFVGINFVLKVQRASVLRSTFSFYEAITGRPIDSVFSCVVSLCTVDYDFPILRASGHVLFSQKFPKILNIFGNVYREMCRASKLRPPARR